MKKNMITGLFSVILVIILINCQGSDFSGSAPTKVEKKTVTNTGANVVPQTPTVQPKIESQAESAVTIKMYEMKIAKPMTQVFNEPRCPNGDVIEYCDFKDKMVEMLSYWCMAQGFEKATAATNTGREEDKSSPSQADCGVTGFDKATKQLQYSSYSDDWTSFYRCTSITCEKASETKTLTYKEGEEPKLEDGWVLVEKKEITD